MYVPYKVVCENCSTDRNTFYASLQQATAAGFDHELDGHNVFVEEAEIKQPEMVKMVSEFPHARCECGHTGDGRGSQHENKDNNYDDDDTIFYGTGPCNSCLCTRFEHKEYLPKYMKVSKEFAGVTMTPEEIEKLSAQEKLALCESMNVLVKKMQRTIQGELRRGQQTQLSFTIVGPSERPMLQISVKSGDANNTAEFVLSESVVKQMNDVSSWLMKEFYGEKKKDEIIAMQNAGTRAQLLKEQLENSPTQQQSH